MVINISLFQDFGKYQKVIEQNGNVFLKQFVIEFSHWVGLQCVIVAFPGHIHFFIGSTVKPVLSGHSKRTPKIGFEDLLSLNAGQKCCRMLQWEHSAILLTFI